MARNHCSLILPDVHTPWHNRRLLGGICRLALDLKPDQVVFSGDFLDMFTLARHNKGSLKKLANGLTLDKEYDIGAGVLRDLESATRKAGRVYLYGNHEDRYERHLEDGDNAKVGRALKSPIEGLRLEEKGYKVYTNWQDDSHKIGNSLEVIHGVTLHRHSAAKHLDDFEGSVMFGHTHRFNTFVYGKRGGYNIGWLGDRDSSGFSYMPRCQRSKWCNGFAIVWTLNDGTFLPAPIQCWNNRFIYNGKTY